jgi:tryptophan-rich sensory protein
MTKHAGFDLFITAVAGLLASLFTLRMGEVFAPLKLPLFFPPLWLLPAGWTAALICLASASATAGTAPGECPDQPESEHTARSHKAAMAFYVSLGLTVCWAALFFRLNAGGAAAITGLLLTGVWLHLRRLTANKQKRLLVCCIWAGYMAYLNMGIWLIN